MKFTVLIIRPFGDTHWQCLKEAATGIVYALQQLGHEVHFDTASPSTLFIGQPFGRLILFNAQHLPVAVQLPEDAIIFNAEQAQIDGNLAAFWYSSAYLDLMRRQPVWDYSEVNAARLRKLRVPRIELCRIGYYPGLSNIKRVAEDLDVLFIGSLCDRRVKALKDVARQRLQVRVLTGVYGDERDDWIARARIVLNIHYYSNPIWEVFRSSHLLANRKCIVSEDGGCDPALESLAAASTAYVPYDHIAGACVNLLKDPARRRDIAERGHKAFFQIDQVEELRTLLQKL